MTMAPTKTTNLEILQFGRLSLTDWDGSKVKVPQVEIRTARIKSGWMWSTTVRLGEFGYGYTFLHPDSSERAAGSRQEAVRNARNEVLERIKGLKIDKKLMAWLHPDARQQLDLFSCDTEAA